MSRNIGFILSALIALLVVLSASMFTVDQRQNALVFQLGEVVSVKTKPGLYFKLPLVQNVRYFDTRILTLDAADPERFITSEKKNVLVDSFIKWRVIDARQFYVSVGGDERRQPVRPAGAHSVRKVRINPAVQSMPGRHLPLCPRAARSRGRWPGR